MLAITGNALYIELARSYGLLSMAQGNPGCLILSGPLTIIRVCAVDGKQPRGKSRIAGSVLTGGDPFIVAFIGKCMIGKPLEDWQTRLIPLALPMIRLISRNLKLGLDKSKRWAEN